MVIYTGYLYLGGAALVAVGFYIGYKFGKSDTRRTCIEIVEAHMNHPSNEWSVPEEWDECARKILDDRREYVRSNEGGRKWPTSRTF
jgi:hypothetical protein